MKVSSVFDKLTYWNLETPPNSDDTIVTAMDWPELAEAVRCPPPDRLTITLIRTFPSVTDKTVKLPSMFYYNIIWIESHSGRWICSWMLISCLFTDPCSSRRLNRKTKLPDKSRQPSCTPG